MNDAIAAVLVAFFVALVLVVSLADNSGPSKPVQFRRIADFSPDPIERMWPKALRAERALAAAAVHDEIEVARKRLELRIQLRIPPYAVMGQPGERVAA